MDLEQSPKVSRKNRWYKKSKEESRPTRLQHCWGRLNYYEECWRPEETCCHSDSSEEKQKSETRDKYLHLARELRKLCNTKVDSDTNCNWCTWNGSKSLERGLEGLEIGGRVDTIQTTPLLRSARILKIVQKSWGDLLSLKLEWKTISANVGVKNSQGVT